MRGWRLLVLALALAGCATPAVVPAPPPTPTAAPFAMDATGCDEVLVQAPVPVAAARAFVPATYALVGEATGEAVAFAALKVCDDLRLDGASVGAASTSDVGVLVESPDGSDAIHYYQAWWATDHALLHARLVALGWNAALVPDTPLSDGRVGGAGTVAGEVPWEAGAYRVEATVASASASGSNLAVGWQDTANGTVRVVKTLESASLGSGPGRVVAEAGSPMAELLGRAGAEGAGLWNAYAMTGRVERAPEG